MPAQSCDSANIAKYQTPRVLVAQSYNQPNVEHSLQPNPLDIQEQQGSNPK